MRKLCPADIFAQLCCCYHCIICPKHLAQPWYEFLSPTIHLPFLLQLKKRPNLLPCEPGRPLLTMHRMRSLAELQQFFHTLVVSHAADSHTALPQATGLRQGFSSRQATKTAASSEGRHSESERKGRNVDDPSSMTNRQYIEHLLQTDFLEHLI